MGDPRFLCATHYYHKWSQWRGWAFQLCLSVEGNKKGNWAPVGNYNSLNKHVSLWSSKHAILFITKMEIIPVNGACILFWERKTEHVNFSIVLKNLLLPKQLITEKQMSWTVQLTQKISLLTIKDIQLIIMTFFLMPSKDILTNFSYV